MQLSQQRLLVIGGTSGFGLAIAGQALQEGANVQIIGQTAAHVSAAMTQLGASDHLTGTALDAQDPTQLKAFFAAQPAFDHVVSMLGGAMGGGFLDNSVAAIRETIEDKFFANLQVAQLASDHLNQHGSLIFTSGAGGRPDNASGAIVGNQAINTMVAGLAVELAPDYRVNAVAPTWTPTGLWRQLSNAQLTEQTAAVSASNPLKRVATPAEVASAYVYLMQNEFITGQVLHVDGGVELV
jgi:NAD(P)-dependent dehydrogenase (short-subunit alcohol dehydrogenase family)